VPGGENLRLQDLVERARQKLGVSGLLVAAQDGLPLAGHVPEGLDANAWSSFGPHLFRKLHLEDPALPPGKPRRFLLAFGEDCFSFWNEQGIYLICRHALKQMTPEFERSSALLADGLARYCKQHASAA